MATEKENVRLLGAWLTHMVRSVHLPARRVRDLLEGKVEGFSGVPGVQMDDNYNFTTDLPDAEQRLSAFSAVIRVLFKYLVTTYDGNIAKRRFFQPAMLFLERNREKIEQLDIAKYIPTRIEELAAETQVEAPKPMVPTETNLLPSGIGGFDKLSGGGIPFAYSILVQAPPGDEVEMFVNQFIKQGIEEGVGSLVVVSNQSPDEFKGTLAAMGVDRKLLEDGDRLRLIDWYSYNYERINGIEEIGPTIKVSKGLTNVGIAINKALRLMTKEGNKRAVMRIPSAAMSDFQRESTLGFVVSTRSKFKGTGITALFIIDREAHSEEVLESFQRVFDGVIDIKKSGNDASVAVISAGGRQGGSDHLPLGSGADGALVVGQPGTKLAPAAKPRPKVSPKVKAPVPVEAPPKPAPPKPVKEPVKEPVKAPTKEPVAVKPKKVVLKAPDEVQASDILDRLRSTKKPEPVKPPVEEKVETKPVPPKPAPVESVELYDDDQISSLAFEATNLVKAGKRKAAIAVYDKILKIDPKEKDTLMKKAVLLQLDGRHEEAVECYDKALKVDPDDAEAWSNRGISLRAVGKVEDAIKSYDKALKLSPRDAGVWSNRGIALRSIGKNKEAIKSYDKALEYNPGDAAVWSNRGVLLTTMKKYKEALESFDKALKADPKYEKARKNRAILLEKMDEES